MKIPADFPVRPLRPGDRYTDMVTCGTCGRSWDDAIVTSMTPAPGARCPFEEFHEPERPKRQRPTAHAPRTHTAYVACKLPPELKARFVAVCYARGDLPGAVTRKLIEAFTQQQEAKR